MNSQDNIYLSPYEDFPGEVKYRKRKQKPLFNNAAERLIFIIISLVCLALLCFLFVSCSTPIGQIKCRHNALTQALIAKEKGYPVRIGVGLSRPLLTGHSQAEAFIDGKWQPLRVDALWVVTSKQDNYIPHRYITIDEAINQLFKGVRK